MSLQDVIPSADAQVGSAGCSTASIGGWTLLGPQGFDPQGLWHGMMCAIVGGIQTGLTLYKLHLSSRESNKSRLTQMIYVLSWW